MCDNIIVALENNGFIIDILTYNDPAKVDNKYRWEHVNLLDEESVENFIKILPDNYYEKIICVPTYNSGTNNPFITTREYLNNVYGSFIINYMILIRNLLSKLSDDGQLIYISSISANTSTDMVDYSAAKACMQAYVSAISGRAKQNQAIFSIAPAMIYDTVAFYHRDEEHSLEPISRLIKKEEIANVILNADKNYNANVVIMNYDGISRIKGFKSIIA